MARIVLQELDSDKTLAVGEVEALLGRDPACAFVIEGPKSRVVSGRHARIFFQDGAWWIQDMSRNGTVLDDERLQAGQRHALREGQVIGLGESGPRLKVATLEARNVAETMIEANVSGDPKVTTAPRVRPQMGGVPTGAPSKGTTHVRVGSPGPEPRSARPEEATEPATLSGEWHVAILLRATHSDQRFEGKASVVRMGRAPECHVRIPPEQGASVSRIHAEIAIGEAGVVIRDAGSRNGTFVNGNKVQGAQPIIAGDRITLGSGGPTLEVAELHIMRGEGTPGFLGGRGLSGGPTPDAMTARKLGAEPFREPPTAPAPLDDAVAPFTRVPAPRMGSPARGQPAEQVPQTGSGSKRTVVWVVLAAIIIVAAVLIGRMSAS